MNTDARKLLTWICTYTLWNNIIQVHREILRYILQAVKEPVQEKPTYIINWTQYYSQQTNVAIYTVQSNKD